MKCVQEYFQSTSKIHEMIIKSVKIKTQIYKEVLGLVKNKILYLWALGDTGGFKPEDNDDELERTAANLSGWGRGVGSDPLDILWPDPKKHKIEETDYTRGVTRNTRHPGTAISTGQSMNNCTSGSTTNLLPRHMGGKGNFELQCTCTSEVKNIRTWSNEKETHQKKQEDMKNDNKMHGRECITTLNCTEASYMPLLLIKTNVRMKQAQAHILQQELHKARFRSWYQEVHFICCHFSNTL